MANWQDRQKTMASIRKGVKVQAEALAEKEGQNKKEEKVTNINFEENRKLTGEEKDQHLLDLTDAVNTLTERLNTLEGSESNE